MKKQESQNDLFSVQEPESSLFDSTIISNPELVQYADECGAFILNVKNFDQLKKSRSGDKVDCLFVRGNRALLQQPAVCVVGTRNPSPDGVKRAQKIASAAVDAGLVVMSGLAKGIDTAAHWATIKKGGATIAVFGTPIHKIYPAENRGLVEAIIESGGLIVSATKPTEPGGKYLFPRRNRLMALMSEGTVIVEAGETSGVVHQAAECLRQGKKLFLLESLVASGVSWAAKFLEGKGSKAEVFRDARQLSELAKNKS